MERHWIPLDDSSRFRHRLKGYAIDRRQRHGGEQEQPVNDQSVCSVGRRSGAAWPRSGAALPCWRRISETPWSKITIKR